MVHGVAGGAVDDGRVGDVFAVVDEHRPEIDEDEEGDVGEFLEREDEGEDVVGEALGEAVHWVERVAGERRGHDPFVVRFVQRLVHPWVVQPSVDPVDAEIGEADEEGELQDVVQGERCVGWGVVELRVATGFDEEEGSGEDGHYGHRDHGLADLETDLIFEVFGVGEGCVVEDIKV